MFEAKNIEDGNTNRSVESVPDPVALTREEVADLIRLAETHGISGTAQLKLILRVKNLKQRAYAKLKQN
ncbi:hypothetical protein H6F96_25370 [Microcoleus sp. FACHB-53]|nr:hypothetical protein [Microcoleus sp. FACHB-53]